MGKNAKVRKEKKIESIKQYKAEMKDRSRQRFNFMKFIKNPGTIAATLAVLAIIAFPIINYAKSMKPSYAVIQTSEGDIKVELFKKDAPKTVENFEKLAGQGFYNNLLWHRVIKDFVIQTGDPNGDGSGGPGYQFADEINSHKILKGTIAMANSGPNTNGSQFFIVTSKDQPQLDGKYTAFGQVVSGMDVVGKIAEKPVDKNDKPIVPVYMEDVKIQ